MVDSSHQLQQVVEKVYGSTAIFIESVPVLETFEGQIVWRGIVHVFSLKGHPSATKCYAWSSPVEGSTKRRYYAVLHAPPIDSPEKAVRASIVRDFKKDK